MTPRLRSLALAPALAVAACTGDRAPPEERPQPPAVVTATTAASQDTIGPFVSGDSTVRRPRPRAGMSLLRTVETGTYAGYDRVLFEFSSDSAPGYSVQYRRGPVRACGSGHVVPLAGAGHLVVRLTPAQAHDDRGNATVTQRERATGYPALKELKLTCDFEGQVEWVLGLPGPAPFRVLELVAPARLAVDVRHHE